MILFRVKQISKQGILQCVATLLKAIVAKDNKCVAVLSRNRQTVISMYYRMQWLVGLKEYVTYSGDFS